MKKLLGILVALSLLPVAFAVDFGTGIDLTITPEDFDPLIWLCDSRVVTDDAIESGRETDVGDDLDERIENYAFEGEQIAWTVLVMDKNKIEEVEDVVVLVDGLPEVECARTTGPSTIPESCNARLDEEQFITLTPDTMDYYDCLVTVEGPYDEENGGPWYPIDGDGSEVSIEVTSTDGSAEIDEKEYWYFNPVIALSVDGTASFDDVRPGSVAYSTPVLVGNDADGGSGVLLDMFISGTDFYDPASSGAKCPTTNHLKLSQDLRSKASLGADVSSGATYSEQCDIDSWINTAAGIGEDNHDHLCYYATNGAYSSADAGNADAEGYRPIVYSDVFTRDFYNDAEIISNDALVISGIAYDAGNVLTPGAEIAIEFKLGLPEPCVGDFSDGDIFFWGEA